MTSGSALARPNMPYPGFDGHGTTGRNRAMLGPNLIDVAVVLACATIGAGKAVSRIMEDNSRESIALRPRVLYASCAVSFVGLLAYVASTASLLRAAIAVFVLLFAARVTLIVGVGAMVGSVLGLCCCGGYRLIVFLWQNPSYLVAAAIIGCFGAVILVACLGWRK